MIYPPDTDASLPLEQRRYPFRPTTPEEVEQVRRDMERAILLVDDMIHRAIADLMGRDVLSQNRHEVDDLAQYARLKIIIALPSYDAQAGAKVSSFLYRVIRNAIKDYRKAHNRHIAQYTDIAILDTIPDTHHPASDVALCRFMRDAGQILTPLEYRAYLAMLNNNNSYSRLDKYMIRGPIERIRRQLRQYIQGECYLDDKPPLAQERGRSRKNRKVVCEITPQNGVLSSGHGNTVTDTTPTGHGRKPARLLNVA